MNKKTQITQNEVRELFDYREDGNLIRKFKKGRNKAGVVAGFYNESQRYRHIVINKRQYLLHRIIWLWQNGCLPKSIDHIDRNRLNNRIENLRACSIAENLANSNKSIKNTSGYKGVSYDKRCKKWRAKIFRNGLTIHLGMFSSSIDAAKAYDAARIAISQAFASINNA